jgi:hypothetical protein
VSCRTCAPGSLKRAARSADQCGMTLRVVSQVTVRLRDGVLTIRGAQPQVTLTFDGER